MLSKNILPLLTLLDFQFHIVRIFNFQISFYTTSKVKKHTLGVKADSQKSNAFKLKFEEVIRK